MVAICIFDSLEDAEELADELIEDNIPVQLMVFQEAPNQTVQ